MQPYNFNVLLESGKEQRFGPELYSNGYLKLVQLFDEAKEKKRKDKKIPRCVMCKKNFDTARALTEHFEKDDQHRAKEHSYLHSVHSMTSW